MRRRFFGSMKSRCTPEVQQVELLLPILQTLLGLIALGLFVVLLATYGRVYLQYAFNLASRFYADLRQEAENRTWEFFEEAQERDFQNWFASKTSGREVGRGVDEEVLRAYQETPELRRLLEEVVPGAIRCCVRTHWLVAVAVQAPYIREIA